MVITERTRWETIDTSTKEGLREIDRAIAERLGWKAVIGNNDGDYFIVDPQGKQYATAMQARTPERAWHCVLNISYWSIPRWSAQEQKALSLVEPTGLEFSMGINMGMDVHNRWWAQFNSHDCNSCANAPTPALAICEAWLLAWDAAHADA